jgi:hypothetical protein
VPATIHPGAVVHYWDHLVISLRNEATRVETGFLSLYAIVYSPTLGAGHVAIVEVPGAGAGGLAAIFTDDIGLGERQQARLRAMGEGRPALARPPIEARFDRIAYGAHGFGFRVRSADHLVEAYWEAVDPPFWVDGQDGGFHDLEDIWALMVGARRARLVVDGRETPGAPFEDDVWTPKLGRPLSSAHGAFAEVRVTPVSDRATGSGRDGPQ